MQPVRVAAAGAVAVDRWVDDDAQQGEDSDAGSDQEASGGPAVSSLLVALSLVGEKEQKQEQEQEQERALRTVAVPMHLARPGRRKRLMAMGALATRDDGHEGADVRQRVLLTWHAERQSTTGQLRVTVWRDPQVCES